jgi:hypothetical protein
MLSETALCIANKIAQRLADKNLQVIPRSGSPVAMLSAGLTSTAVQTLLPNQYLDVIKTDSATYGAVNGEGAIHDEKMEWCVELIRKGVSKDLDVAKNTVKPVIDMVLADIEKDLMEACSDKAHGYEIVQDNLPKFFGNQKIENLFERYKNIPIKPIETLRVFPELAAAEIQRRISTGDDEVNELLADIVNPDALDEIADLYQWNFREGGRERIDFSGAQTDPSVPVILYFLTLGLEADLPEGTNASIGVVGNYLKNLRGMLGAVVYRTIRQIERKIDDKELIRSVDGYGSERKIHVNKVVYDKFLDEGGSPEAIFGAVCGRTSFSYGAILDGTTKLEKIWGANLDAIKNTNSLNKLGLVIVSMRKSLSKYIEEMEVIPAESGGKGEMQKRLTVAARNFYLTDMDSLPQSVKRVVFNVVFPAQTNARYIIDAMDKQECEDGGHKRLAASVTLMLIAEWLVKNVEVGKGNATI